MKKSDWRLTLTEQDFRNRNWVYIRRDGATVGIDFGTVPGELDITVWAESEKYPKIQKLFLRH